MHRAPESPKVLLRQSLIAEQRSSRCIVRICTGRNRAIVASFDGGRITTDAGALLLGAADRVSGLTGRFAACFKDTVCRLW